MYLQHEGSGSGYEIARAQEFEADKSHPPVYFLMRSLAFQHQLLVGDLELSSRHVQLLVDFRMLLVHLP